MRIIEPVIRFLVVLTFFVAGMAKVFDLQGTRRAIRNFGMPERAGDALGIVLPVAELVVAALLIPSATVLWGSIVASWILLSFIVSISINLARGRKPDCHCFGQLHSK